MRTIILVLALLATPAFAGNHFDAKNCEIFVDKVKAPTSSHGIHGMVFFLKTLNDRLDGAIAEVGLRATQSYTDQHSPDPYVTPWQDYPAARYLGASDYFEIEVALGSDFSEAWAEGVFYVRTTKGTTYWLKPSSGKNYAINDDMWADAWYSYGSQYPHYSMIPTQEVAKLRPLNPDVCH